MRIGAWLCLAFGLLLAVPVIASPDAAAQADSVNVSTIDYVINDPATETAAVEITLTPGDTPVGSVEFVLNYDATLIAPSLDAASGLPECTTNLGAGWVGSCGPANPDGSITVALFNIQGGAGEAVIVTIPFGAVGPGGVSALDIVIGTGSDVGGQPLPFTSEDGSVTIAGDEPTPTPTPTAEPTATPTPTTEPTATPTATPTTEATATPTATPTTEATATPTPTTEPTTEATATPTPTTEPTTEATATPTPTTEPTTEATATPTTVATAAPTAVATVAPTTEIIADIPADPGTFSTAPETLSISGAEAAFLVPNAQVGTAGSGDGVGGTVGGTGGDAGGQGASGDGPGLAATGAETPVLASASVALLTIGGVLMVNSRRRDED